MNERLSSFNYFTSHTQPFLRLMFALPWITVYMQWAWLAHRQWLSPWSHVAGSVPLLVALFIFIPLFRASRNLMTGFTLPSIFLRTPPTTPYTLSTLLQSEHCPPFFPVSRRMPLFMLSCQDLPDFSCESSHWSTRKYAPRGRYSLYRPGYFYFYIALEREMKGSIN